MLLYQIISYSDFRVSLSGLLSRKTKNQQQHDSLFMELVVFDLRGGSRPVGTAKLALLALDSAVFYASVNQG